MKLFKRVAVLAVAVAALAVPAIASAAPAPGFEEFTGCPSRADNPTITSCAVTEIYDGHLQMGTKDTPIEDPFKLTVAANTFGQGVVSKIEESRQRIPGGLIGITGLDWLRFIYPFNALQIYAEPELAGQVGSIFPPIEVPLKVQLHNVLLNNNCYIGANNDPINLRLDTGTTNPPPPNQPITGSSGVLVPNPTNPLNLRFEGLQLVDNAFAAPAARNCDLFSLNLLITALVNSQSGLPSPAGTNEAVQDANLNFGPIEHIYPPDGID